MNQKTEKFIKNALLQGAYDSLIAKQISGLIPQDIVEFRAKHGITAHKVNENRYNTWLKLVKKGHSLEKIAKVYGVNEASIKIALKNKRGYTFPRPPRELKPKKSIEPFAEQINNGIANGGTDKMIANNIPGLTALDVFHYRHEHSIKSKTVLKNRYNTWVKMLESGYSLEKIGEIYDVLPRSIKILLWKNKNISLVKIKKTALDQLNKRKKAQGFLTGDVFKQHTTDSLI